MRILLAIVLGLVPSFTNAQQPDVPAADASAQPPQRIRLGGTVTAAKMMHKVEPVYPPLARQARISGTVTLRTIIGRDGKVKQLEVLSGHPLLVQAALDAVRQWEYQPTLLNGEPVEIETTIDVIFELRDHSPDGDQPAQSAPANAGGTKEAKILRTEPDEIDSVLRADLEKLLAVTGTERQQEAVCKKILESLRPILFRSVGDQIARARILDSFQEKFLKVFTSDRAKEGMIAVYAAYFDDEDIKALIAFNESTAGKKMLRVMPQLSGDLIELGERLARESLPQINRELCAENAELLGKLPECKPNDAQKSELLRPREPFAPTVKNATN